MKNKEIIKILRLTASLLELYGENQFKVRSYQTAVYNLERTSVELSGLDSSDLAKLPGVGKSIAATIQELNQSGSSSTLDNLLKQTPIGIQELLKIKGLAARKIKTAWDELGIESAEELLRAAQRGILADLPGFGAKTQENILQVITFHLSSRDLFHYKDGHLTGIWLEEKLAEKFPEIRLNRTGSFRRKAEVLRRMEYLWATENIRKATEYLDGMEELSKNIALSGPLRWRGEIANGSLNLDIRFCKPTEFGSKLLYYTGNIAHLHQSNNSGKQLSELLNQPYKLEDEIYKDFGWPAIIPELREGLFEKEFLLDGKQDEIITPDQIRGILHNHSTYSDGKNSLLEMAESCKELGYEYFGISDHSQTAVYANGLDQDRLNQQLQEIDQLNKKLAPFKIFKGIESDILNDGSLDYPASVLQALDFVVASIHSNLNMDIEQATKRLIRAIENPYTTILGHPTGRQLLKREGYPIDYEKVIEACAENAVVIEINAHPWRLDLDWRWVSKAVEKGIMISINPDAHEVAGLQDVQYGINVARKAGLPTKMTFNAMSVNELEQYLIKRSKQQLANNSN
ncbi:MAG: DNA polymerase/3'-5' exonuclease PolX [Cyclobacteriaceae bacterium]|nr:MAG: DNA polymerase/3'-5' exonuclease PolX [Cyclobacteriaceae bacterium]